MCQSHFSFYEQLILILISFSTSVTMILFILLCLQSNISIKLMTCHLHSAGITLVYNIHISEAFLEQRPSMVPLLFYHNSDFDRLHTSTGIGTMLFPWKIAYGIFKSTKYNPFFICSIPCTK